MTVPTVTPESRRDTLLRRLFHIGQAADRAILPDAVSSIFSSPPAPVARDDDHSSSTPEPRLYLEARRQIKRRAWGHAQRALEQLAVREPAETISLDLDSVRTIRRMLHRLAKWPSDIDAHLGLGRAYFDLDLGSEALAEFVLIQHLAPRRFEGFAMATFEHIFRGEYAVAASSWSRARELKPELPPIEEILGSLPTK